MGDFLLNASKLGVPDFDFVVQERQALLLPHQFVVALRVGVRGLVHLALAGPRGIQNAHLAL